MPITVSQLLIDSGLNLTGIVKWGEQVNNSSPGIYIVSLSDDPDKNNGILPSPPISSDKIQEWMNKNNKLIIEGEKPTPNKLIFYLKRFWLPEENIIYIGATDDSLKGRIKEMYRHKIGKSSPHAGGQWLKTLKILNHFWIYFAESENLKEKESLLLYKFICGQKCLNDTKIIPLPFANLKVDKV